MDFLPVDFNGGIAVLGIRTLYIALKLNRALKALAFRNILAIIVRKFNDNQMGFRIKRIMSCNRRCFFIVILQPLFKSACIINYILSRICFWNNNC